jgi:hypothetical protein
MNTQPFDMELACIEIEKIVSTYVTNESRALRVAHGDILANELEITVACQFLARVIAWQHVLTGESLTSLRQRAQESCNYATKIFIEKSIDIINERRGHGARRTDKQTQG